VTACRTTGPRVDPNVSIQPLQFAAEYIVRQGPSPSQPTLGGISGLASLHDGRELLGISDDRENSRVYRFRVEGTPPDVRVEPTAMTRLQTGTGGPAKLDPEGIAVTRDGQIFISSEGIGNEEPRLPPAILEYSATGQFVRGIDVRARYAPPPHGEATSGVRANAGFESLTISPDGRLFTAAELPLVQDGDVAPFGPGSRTRLLEYRPSARGFHPAREFAYDIDGMKRPPFTPTIAINGIVELLALGGDEFLSLERGYTESANRAQSLNSIRIFRVSLAGATDISTIASLRNAPTITPVRKSLVLDLNDIKGLSPVLATLENFEGMAWGPPLPDGRRQLLIVSDDNFSTRQVTAFLSFAAGPTLRGRPGRSGSFR